MMQLGAEKRATPQAKQDGNPISLRARSFKSPSLLKVF
ncbi:hypothetical protein AM1_A0284 (plasmid) [Acaryochloris marina MBIC11017]|uniref:Uncharacterized protein n=1 Tax=Acaryochloris marina (strain MBIC 11017) TaxID=329726 RepID=A8ZKT4_ACAM1|nr:hypothetical protein AM1_A0284 [Acaryochloris marina MBIC11017]